MTPSTFQGFSPDTFSFLAGLTFNNDRAWFDAHRADYEQLVVAPALALIAEIDPLVRAVSPHYRGVAKKTGGSLMRIYRDTRFSNDKTPYKTNIGIQFRHVRAADVHAPGFYLHLDLDQCFFGAGTWRPEPVDLLAIRRSMADFPDRYTDAVARSTIGTGLALTGESLTRAPKGFDPAHPLVADLRRKDFLVSTDLPSDLFLGRNLVGVLESHLKASAPYMAWLCQALGAEF